jgi:hypothetical protein
MRCGGPRDRPIYFSADWDTTDGYQVGINDYCRGAASVIGQENVGVYGGYWSVSRALDAGVARWAWQTVAWSGSNRDPRINIMQRNDLGYAYVAGVQCDIDEAKTPDCGRWGWTGGDDMAQLPQGELEEVRDLVRWMAAPVSGELRELFASRSIYRDNNDRIDTMAGFVLNAGSMLHEAFVEREAMLGEQWPVELVARLARGEGPGARGSVDPNDTTPNEFAINRAKFILSKVPKTVTAASVSNTAATVSQHIRRGEGLNTRSQRGAQ